MLGSKILNTKISMIKFHKESNNADFTSHSPSNELKTDSVRLSSCSNHSGTTRWKIKMMKIKIIEIIIVSMREMKPGKFS